MLLNALQLGHDVGGAAEERPDSEVGLRSLGQGLPSEIRAALVGECVYGASVLDCAFEPLTSMG